MAYESGNVRPGANTIIDIYSLFLHCNSLYILCFYCHSNHYVILIAFKNKTKNQKNRPVQNTSIILNELLNKHVVYYFKNSVH